MHQFLVKILGESRKRALRGIFLTVIFLVGAIAMQYRYDAIEKEYFDLHAAEHRYVVPASIVKHAAFGFQNVLADYYWITAIQALNKWDRKDVYFSEYFHIISSLDPKFEYPYIFASLIIPSKKNPDSLAQLSGITEMGMSAFPESWEIPFYTGMQYHVVERSREKATKYLAIAASKQSAPEYVRNAYGIFLMHDATEYQKSRVLFETIYETSENVETRRIAKERIELLDYFDVLEQAAKMYKQKYGAYPTSLGDMEKAGLIKVVPEFAKKFPITIDPKTGKVNLR